MELESNNCNIFVECEKKYSELKWDLLNQILQIVHLIGKQVFCALIQIYHNYKEEGKNQENSLEVELLENLNVLVRLENEIGIFDINIQKLAHYSSQIQGYLMDEHLCKQNIRKIKLFLKMGKVHLELNISHNDGQFFQFCLEALKFEK
jgi:hypothetical protein